jgi:hypothetical protein
VQLQRHVTKPLCEVSGLGSEYTQCTTTSSHLLCLGGSRGACSQQGISLVIAKARRTICV